MSGPPRVDLARPLLLAEVLTALAACGGPKDPIVALISELERASEARDAEAVVRHLATDFRGSGGLVRGDVGPFLRRYFAAYEAVNLNLYDIAIERGEATAQARFRVDFDGRPLQLGGLGGSLPPSATYRFELGLRLVESRWTVGEAAWEEITALAPAPASP